MWTLIKLKLNIDRRGSKRGGGNIYIFSRKPREATWWMLKRADKPSDGSTQCLTWPWVYESYGSMARIKQFDWGTTAAHL